METVKSGNKQYAGGKKKGEGEVWKEGREQKKGKSVPQAAGSHLFDKQS